MNLDIRFYIKQHLRLHIIYEIYYIYKKVRDKNLFSSLTIGKDYDLMDHNNQILLFLCIQLNI